MSIAIAVVLRPSKIIHRCLLTFSVLLVLIGIYIVYLNNLSVVSRGGLTLICVYAAWRSFFYDQKLAKTSWHIHINDQGQLRCQPNFAANSAPLSIMTGSTLWSHALFLRLHNPEENNQFSLVILPDALSKDEFRRLSVACKWIVARSSRKSGSK